MAYRSLDMDDVRIANCASCKKEIVKLEDWEALNPVQQNQFPAGPVAGRLGGRPLCDICYSYHMQG